MKEISYNGWSNIKANIADYDVDLVFVGISRFYEVFV